jgi:hypothetical protein
MIVRAVKSSAASVCAVLVVVFVSVMLLVVNVAGFMLREKFTLKKPTLGGTENEPSMGYPPTTVGGALEADVMLALGVKENV